METKNCPICGGEISATAKFCRHCGAAIDSAAEPVAAPEPKPADAPAAITASVAEPAPNAVVKKGRFLIWWGVLNIIDALILALFFSTKPAFIVAGSFTLSAILYFVAASMGRKGVSGGKRVIRAFLIILGTLAWLWFVALVIYAIVASTNVWYALSGLI